jgi:AraC family transcriptional regulator, regulatory protein of adaptative response / DNA-3-methyladenine glycosylase II
VAGVSAVTTTGIYCRPGCGGRPLAHNVRHFPLAASAEAAGYRACLQCRPYRYPQDITGQAPDLICRAVRLILGGALDDGVESELAARLGVSDRHLRRLFMNYLGVTPDGLARSARTHFARRLLDDTDLTITEIAYVAGFGTPRQLNRACRQVFRATPTQLRARRRKADRLVADGGLLLRLPFHGPLEWEPMAAYLAATSIPGVESVSDGTYRRTALIDGDPGVLELAAGSADHMRLLLHLPHWQPILHIVDQARRIAMLDDQPLRRRRLGADPLLDPSADPGTDRYVPGTWDGFETLIHTVIAEGFGAGRARPIVAAVVERLGRPVPGLRNFELTHLFPTPDVVATSDLCGVGIADELARCLRLCAQATSDGRIALDHSVDVVTLARSLTAIDGVTPTTAHYVASRLGERLSDIAVLPPVAELVS